MVGLLRLGATRGRPRSTSSLGRHFVAVRDGVKHFIIDSMYHLDHMQNLHMTDWLHNVILHMILSANNYHLRLGWPIPSRPKSNAPYSDRQTFFSELSSPVLSLLRIGTMITTNTE